MPLSRPALLASVLAASGLLVLAGPARAQHHGHAVAHVSHAPSFAHSAPATGVSHAAGFRSATPATHRIFAGGVPAAVLGVGVSPGFNFGGGPAPWDDLRYRRWAYPHYHGVWRYPQTNAQNPYASSTAAYYSPALGEYGPAEEDTADDSSPDEEEAVASTSAPAPAPATVRILLADAEGGLWFNGQRMASTGPVRTFTTPVLDPSQHAYYDLRAVWQQDGRPVTVERRVFVTPGATVVVDLRQP
jgi:uncharacterized protein (TIGR03000 family)